jgi:hypothetical protein
MSGKGESKLLEYCLYQDIAAGRGCGLIDPHFLLVDDLLRLLVTRSILANPDIRHPLIYVDPACTDYVVPFNVLATEAEHPYDIAATVLEAFRRTWPECLSETSHFSNVVTTALIVLIKNGLTLMHMPRLLTNTEFREQCLGRVTDSSIVEFFIGAFSLNPRLKLMLGQRANPLDFQAIIDEGKILLLDLEHSDGETLTLSGRLPPLPSRTPDGALSSWTPRWNQYPAQATPSHTSPRSRSRNMATRISGVWWPSTTLCRSSSLY